MNDPGGQPNSNGSEEQPAMRRAEEMVDRLGERIGSFASRVGQQIRKLGARAREEAEDIWAEAQNLRHGEDR